MATQARDILAMGWKRILNEIVIPRNENAEAELPHGAHNIPSANDFYEFHPVALAESRGMNMRNGRDVLFWVTKPANVDVAYATRRPIHRSAKEWKLSCANYTITANRVVVGEVTHFGLRDDNNTRLYTWLLNEIFSHHHAHALMLVAFRFNTPQTTEATYNAERRKYFIPEQGNMVGEGHAEGWGHEAVGAVPLLGGDQLGVGEGELLGVDQQELNVELGAQLTWYLNHEGDGDNEGFKGIGQGSGQPSQSGQDFQHVHTDPVQLPAEGEGDLVQLPADGEGDPVQLPADGEGDPVQLPAEGEGDPVQLPADGEGDPVQLPAEGEGDPVQLPAEGEGDNHEKVQLIDYLERVPHVDLDDLLSVGQDLTGPRPIVGPANDLPLVDVGGEVHFSDFGGGEGSGFDGSAGLNIEKGVPEVQQREVPNPSTQKIAQPAEDVAQTDNHEKVQLIDYLEKVPHVDLDDLLSVGQDLTGPRPIVGPANDLPLVDVGGEVHFSDFGGGEGSGFDGSAGLNIEKGVPEFQQPTQKIAQPAEDVAQTAEVHNMAEGAEGAEKTDENTAEAHARKIAEAIRGPISTLLKEMAEQMADKISTCVFDVVSKLL